MYLTKLLLWVVTVGFFAGKGTLIQQQTTALAKEDVELAFGLHGSGPINQDSCDENKSNLQSLNCSKPQSMAAGPTQVQVVSNQNQVADHRRRRACNREGRTRERCHGPESEITISNKDGGPFPVISARSSGWKLSIYDEEEFERRQWNEWMAAATVAEQDQLAAFHRWRHATGTTAKQKALDEYNRRGQHVQDYKKLAEGRRLAMKEIVSQRMTPMQENFYQRKLQELTGPKTPQRETKGLTERQLKVLREMIVQPQLPEAVRRPQLLLFTKATGRHNMEHMQQNRWNSKSEYSGPPTQFSAKETHNPSHQQRYYPSYQSRILGPSMIGSTSPMGISFQSGATGPLKTVNPNSKGNQHPALSPVSLISSGRATSGLKLAGAGVRKPTHSGTKAISPSIDQKRSGDRVGSSNRGGGLWPNSPSVSDTFVAHSLQDLLGIARPKSTEPKQAEDSLKSLGEGFKMQRQDNPKTPETVTKLGKSGGRKIKLKLNLKRKDPP